MKLAFTLFHYFPYGGLERDMLAMARTCKARGHQVTIYTQRWAGELPADIPVQLVPVRALSNHGRAREFARRFMALRHQQTIDLVVGFNKMPGLDVYYAADTCFAQKVYEGRHWLYRFSGRSRAYLDLENAVFAPASSTQILLIAPAQKAAFQRYYQTPDVRLHRLPPGIRRDRVMPADYAIQREQGRAALGAAPDTLVLLAVGSDFARKGLSRTIKAMAALPPDIRARTRLWVAGQDDATSAVRLAGQLGIASQVQVLGARDDVAQLMWSADMLLHPAHSEAAGAVLLEAMVAGLPVIATAVCGYAPYIAQWQLGKVIADGDTQLADAIVDIAAQDRAHWLARARDFIAHGDVFSMMDHAVAIIESMGTGKLSDRL
ncbi:glycosyltransferase family 4 protein [Cellvibrio japonicus]|uniref:Glycosyl transferase, putative, gt4E n=1 Tax=Cellvibrio japonicus (strain Ueda107) TaxID=498211 RepID=B3PIZ3_CELJU|nr:glycosyltransferase family 4 protein [Cellvibrio japonicus]ACE86120.1 glycosyl transferase, putative, gt4E [Cellvibrio japonicus Ueda107]QEI11199.1 glycosyltransferase family 4 protein [Cellvibrio japonicus]QEI14773.1 glycosyltransferase family 4 protein [Cellvibrio japonicus]QEI18353.1 glycosyltransferase family 4 protein [Cellvibrio japonicus]